MRKAIGKFLSGLAFVALAGISPLCPAITIAICGNQQSAGDGSCPGAPNPNAVTIGSAVGGATVIQDAQSVYIGVGVNAVGTTPAGWTQNGPGVAATPPSAANATNVFSCSWGPQSLSGQSSGPACSAAIAAIYGYSVCSATATTFGLNDGAGCGGGGVISGATPSCPPGYGSPSGGICTLTDAPSVMKPSDGSCSVRRIGNVFSKDPQDPDCLATAGTPATNFSVSTAGGVATAGNASGTTTITINGTTGAATVVTSTAGTSSTHTNSIAVGAPGSIGVGGGSGLVVGTSQSVSQGTGTLTGEGNGGGDCGAPGQPPCRIDESGTPTGTGISQAGKDGLDAAAAAKGGMATWGGGTLTPMTSIPTLNGSDSCSDPTFTLFGGKSVTVGMCQVTSPLKSLIAFFLYAIAGLYIWRKVAEAV